MDLLLLLKIISIIVTLIVTFLIAPLWKFWTILTEIKVDIGKLKQATGVD